MERLVCLLRIAVGRLLTKARDLGGISTLPAIKRCQKISIFLRPAAYILPTYALCGSRELIFSWQRFLARQSEMLKTLVIICAAEAAI